MRPVPTRSRCMIAVQIRERRVGAHAFPLQRVAGSLLLAETFRVEVRQRRSEHWSGYQRRRKRWGTPLPVCNTSTETSLPSQVHPTVEGKVDRFCTVESNIEPSVVTTRESDDKLPLILYKSVRLDMCTVQCY